MGLNDRDWYHEAIAEKNKKNQEPIGPIWTPKMLRSEKRKTFLEMVFQILPAVITVGFIVTVLIKYR